MRIKSSSLTIGILLGVVVMFLIGAATDRAWIGRYQLISGVYESHFIENKTLTNTPKNVIWKIDTATGKVWEYHEYFYGMDGSATAQIGFREMVEQNDPVPGLKPEKQK